MSATHLSLHYHFVFSTKDRISFIDDSWICRLHSFMGGTVRAVEGVAVAVGGTADHIHLLARLRATHKIADVVRDVKHASSQWIHETIGVSDFSWQTGYGAFTVSISQLEVVSNYIARQRHHHKKRTFEQEYVEFLRKNRIEYDERYLW